jgi:hypothetical protein
MSTRPPLVVRGAVFAALLTLVALAACTRQTARPTGATAAPAPASAPAAPASAPAPQAQLAAARGEVEVRRGGRWTQLGQGARLDKDDVIRTAPGATATVVMGEDIEVQLQASSEVSLRDLSATASRVRLERGRLGASVTSDRVVLKVESSASSAVAEARRGRFAVYTDGKGLVAVTASAGEVKLHSSGGDALLGAGERATVVKDAAPQREAVPASVFLKVKWPEAETGARTVVVRGRADVGSEVAVNGLPTEVAGDGTFTAAVTVGAGRTDLAVVATDLAGRSATARGAVVGKHTAPRIQVEKPVWR